MNRLLSTLATLGLALVAGAAQACDHDVPKIGYLGISDLSCDCSTNFSVRSRDGERTVVRMWTFRGEPVVRGIESDGPAAGRLREDDVITAVDGALITTREGSKRFSTLTPGQHITLTVRRDGKEMPVSLQVGAICPEELGGPFSMSMLVAPRVEPVPPIPSVAPAPPAPPAERTPAVPPTPALRWRQFEQPRVMVLPRDMPKLPRGWIGIGLNCQDCGPESTDDSKGTPVWNFSMLPTISFVDPEGPAAKAGLRRGDQLTHVDGISLLTEEGGRRFGAVRPGQTIKWTLVRDGSTRNVAVTASVRPGERRVAADALRDQLRALRELRGLRGLDPGELEAQRKSIEEALRTIERSRVDQQRVTRQDRRLRYAGTVAGSDVEVRGVGNVVVDDAGEEIVITTPEATIRIRPSGAKEKKKSEK